MRLQHRITTLAALLVVSLSAVRAQSPADPSGHWTGTIQIPGRDVNIEIDIARAATGDLGGTIGVPSQDLSGLPLLKVAVEGRVVSFHARRDQTFVAHLSDDSRSMAGDFTISGSTVPFTLVRAGEAKIEPAPKSSPIGKELEGTWSATIDASGTQLRVVLQMANGADGASGRLIHLDEGGLEIPVVISQQAAHVTLEATVVAGSFAGDLNRDGSELSGTWTKGQVVMPVTFRRAATEQKH